MRPVLFVLAMLVSGCASKSSLVGAQVPPYPAGLTERSGTCLPAGGGAKDCQFSVSVLDSDRGGRATAVALESLSRDSKGQPVWRVVDSVEIPDVRSGYSIEMGGCRAKQHKDEGIVAIVRAGQDKFWSESYWAVRFDRKKKRFATVTPADVDCAGSDPNCL